MEVTLYLLHSIDSYFSVRKRD